MELFVIAFFICAVVGVVIKASSRVDRRNQLSFISAYSFRPALKEKVIQKYPHLQAEEAELVLLALKDYFLFCNRAEARMLAMPSQVVDVAWHEFILFTREYESFCDRAFGRFLHHTPTEAMKTKTVAQEGIKRAWRLACAKENINARNPEKLPLLFAIDSLLAIEDGFTYSLNCEDRNSSRNGDGFCAAHIGCSSDGCGGGCGSDGCGGGGCGGCGGD